MTFCRYLFRAIINARACYFSNDIITQQMRVSFVRSSSLINVSGMPALIFFEHVLEFTAARFASN